MPLLRLHVITCFHYKKTAALLFILLVPCLQFVLNVNFLPSKLDVGLYLIDKDTNNVIEKYYVADSVYDTSEDLEKSIDINGEDVKVHKDLYSSSEESSVALKLYRNRQKIVPSRTNLSIQHLDLTVWSLSDQFGAFKDLNILFSDFGVKFHHYELQTLCSTFRNCPVELNGISESQMLETLPTIRSEVHGFLKSIPQFLQSDIVLCVSPISLCDIYLPFNKTVIIWITNRYNHGITSPTKWQRLNKILHTITHKSGNLIVASNDYDSQYCNYFTSWEPTVLPPYAGYIRSHEHLVTNTSVIGLHSFINSIHQKKFMLDFNRICAELNFSITLQKYKSDVGDFKAIIYLPSRVSSLNFVELYRLNIPIFAPSLELLTRWHYTNHLITHKSQTSVSVSGISSRSAIRGTIQLPDPNNDKDLPSIGFWLQFMDIYTYSHIQYFQSMKQLVEKLRDLEISNLQTIAKDMSKYNEKQMSQIRMDWWMLLSKIKT